MKKIVMIAAALAMDAAFLNTSNVVAMEEDSASLSSLASLYGFLGEKEQAWKENYDLMQEELYTDIIECQAEDYAPRGTQYNIEDINNPDYALPLVCWLIREESRNGYIEDCRELMPTCRNEGGHYHPFNFRSFWKNVALSLGVLHVHIFNEKAMQEIEQLRKNEQERKSEQEQKIMQSYTDKKKSFLRNLSQLLDPLSSSEKQLSLYLGKDKHNIEATVLVDGHSQQTAHFSHLIGEIVRLCAPSSYVREGNYSKQILELVIFGNLFKSKYVRDRINSFPEHFKRRIEHYIQKEDFVSSCGFLGKVAYSFDYGFGPFFDTHVFYFPACTVLSYLRNNDYGSSEFLKTACMLTLMCAARSNVLEMRYLQEVMNIFFRYFFKRNADQSSVVVTINDQYLMSVIATYEKNKEEMRITDLSQEAWGARSDWGENMEKDTDFYYCRSHREEFDKKSMEKYRHLRAMIEREGQDHFPGISPYGMEICYPDLEEIISQYLSKNLHWKLKAANAVDAANKVHDIKEAKGKARRAKKHNDTLPKKEKESSEKEKENEELEATNFFEDKDLESRLSTFRETISVKARQEELKLNTKEEVARAAAFLGLIFISKGYDPVVIPEKIKHFLSPVLNEDIKNGLEIRIKKGEAHSVIPDTCYVGIKDLINVTFSLLGGASENLEKEQDGHSAYGILGYCANHAPFCRFICNFEFEDKDLESRLSTFRETISVKARQEELKLNTKEEVARAAAFLGLIFISKGYDPVVIPEKIKYFLSPVLNEDIKNELEIRIKKKEADSVIPDTCYVRIKDLINVTFSSLGSAFENLEQKEDGDRGCEILGYCANYAPSCRFMCNSVLGEDPYKIRWDINMLKIKKLEEKAKKIEEKFGHSQEERSSEKKEEK